MIIEQLISNYLDGDLTPEQDLELRNLVSADPAARKSFDEAVLVHIAMRCEDETDVPDDLRAEVFSQVDAIAREDEHLKEATMILRHVSGTAMRRVGAVLAIFLAFWVPIHESQFGVSDPAEYSLVVPTALVAPAEVAITQKPAVLRQRAVEEAAPAGVVHSNDFAIEGGDPNVRSDASLIADASLFPKSRTDGSSEPSVTLSSIFRGSGSVATAPTDSDQSGFSGTPAEQIEEFYQSEPAYVSVTTSYAAGVASSVANTSNVEQLAASIGFGVTDEDVIGLELGSTSYSYTRTSTLTEQTGASVARMSMVNDGASGGKLASPTPTTGSYETTETQLNQQGQSVWGAAFYERRILAADAFSVRGRAGAGVATDGVVGFGRITSELALGSSISLVVGAEARAMPFRLGPIQGKGTSTQYGAVFTALTGIHVRF